MTTETSNAREWKDWMRDREKVVGLAEHLEQVGWRQDERGDAQCFDQGSAMAAEVIRHVLLPMLDTPPPAAARGDVRGLVEALVREIERNTCMHEETYRGGAIWEICRQCGAQWADDEGGRPEFKWPECVESASEWLAAEGVQPEARGVVDEDEVFRLAAGSHYGAEPNSYWDMDRDALLAFARALTGERNG